MTMNTGSSRKHYMAYVDPPHQCYNTIKGILLKTGLNPSLYETCLLSGVLAKPSSPDTIYAVQFQLYVGLFVDNFIFYYSDQTQEVLFKILLQEHIQVDFMGDVEYFLGTTFTWIKHKDRNISFHICQYAFTGFTAHWFLVHTANKVPNMTPYSSGFPVDSIPPFEPLDPNLPRQRQVYQSIIGYINFLATWTHSDIAPVLTFLASCSNATSPQ